MELLKDVVNKLQMVPGHVQTQELQGAWGGARQRGTGGKHTEEEADIASLEMCTAARRVIGFLPIEPRMLDMQVKSFGARSMEEAKVMEIKSYLKCEMKMKHADIEKLEMIKIFPPAKEDWNVLYVELGSDSQVDMVMAHTRYMVKKDHRVVRWYPRQMYERYRAVEAIAYEIRRTKNLKTRVKVGKDDIELSTREAGSTYWRQQVLPDSLPRFDMRSTRSDIPTSPPPGRPWGTCGFPQLEQVNVDKTARSDNKVDETEKKN